MGTRVGPEIRLKQRSFSFSVVKAESYKEALAWFGKVQVEYPGFYSVVSER